MWIKSGIVEELDQKQVGLLTLVQQKIELYYRVLYRTRLCYQYPLSLSRLMKLCQRSASSVTLALRYLANTTPIGSQREPPIYYDRIKAEKNKSHRPYRIFLRRHKYD